MRHSTRDCAAREGLGQRFSIRELARSRGFKDETIALSEVLCIDISPGESCNHAACFELLTYNTALKGSYPGANLHNKKRAPEMISRLAETDCDVLLLQEVYVPAMRKLLVKGPLHGFRRRGGLVNGHQYVDYKSQNIGAGLLTITKWPLVDSKRYYFERNPGIRKRGVLYTQIDKLGMKYHVFNTHLWWDKHSSRNTCGRRRGLRRRRYYHEDQKHREEQVKEIAAFVRSLGIAEGEPTVIGGDFNFGGPHDPRYWRCRQDNVKGYEELKDILKATDLFEYPADPDPGNRILDHVFYRNYEPHPCLSFVEELSFKTEIDWNRAPNLSDHHPYKARFEVAGWELEEP